MMSKRLTALLLASWSQWALAFELGIDVLGVNETQKQNILAQLSLYQAKDDEDLNFEQAQLLHQKAFAEIPIALQPFGYYHIDVQGEFTQTNAGAQATYQITLGRPTLVDSLKLQVEGPGSHSPVLQKLQANFPLQTGDIFSHNDYEKGKSLAQQAAYQEGFIKAYFDKHEVLVDLSTYSADIDLLLSTGPQYTIGDLSFANSYYADDFLLEFADRKQYQPYRSETLVNLESRYLQSGLFRKAEIEPTFAQDSTSVPLHVKLEDAPANRYLLGIGYDTNTRSRIRAGWDRKKINTRGHQFKTQFKISEKDTLFDAAYIIPGTKPWVDNYQLTFNYADDEYKDKPSELYTVAFKETKELTHFNRTLALRYLSETFTDSDGLTEKSNFLLPSITLTRSNIDNVINPTEGYRAEVQLRGGIDSLFSDADFIQIYGQYKYLKGLTKYNTLITRFELGATFPDDIDKLPLSIRYYAGGIDSLRGFRYRSIPNEINDDGELEPVGGAYLAIASLEVDQTIWGPIKGAVFVDAGGAFRKWDDDWQLGVGLGLRWQTPVGPLKVDLAKPISDTAEVIRLHFSFGPQI